MGWSDLPSDLVISIATRLPDPGDVVRFRAVCRSWESASRSFRPATFFPWLAVIPDNYDPTKDELSFISHATNDRIYKLTMPPPHNIYSSITIKDGWMMFIIREIFVLMIVNPLTGAQLPCLPSFYTFLDHQRLGRLWEDLDFVFFLSDYLVAFAECCVDGRHILAVAMPGDDEWSVIRLSSSFRTNGIRSIVFHEADRKFYAMHCDGHMQSFRLDRCCGGRKTVFGDVSYILAEATGWHQSVSHLVSDGNNLLRVRKYLRSKKFDMLKYCPDADMWVKVMNMDLGDNSLFFDFFGARLLPLSQGDGSPKGTGGREGIASTLLIMTKSLLRKELIKKWKKNMELTKKKRKKNMERKRKWKTRKKKKKRMKRKKIINTWKKRKKVINTFIM